MFIFLKGTIYAPFRKVPIGIEYRIVAASKRPILVPFSEYEKEVLGIE